MAKLLSYTQRNNTIKVSCRRISSRPEVTIFIIMGHGQKQPAGVTKILKYFQAFFTFFTTVYFIYNKP